MKEFLSNYRRRHENLAMKKINTAAKRRNNLVCREVSEDTTMTSFNLSKEEVMANKSE